MLAWVLVASLPARSDTSEFDDPNSFASAKRGFIAAPAGKVKNRDGEIIWDFESFSFVNGPAPATVHPGLWRQALLNNNAGLFKVTDGIHQLRGFDIANMTLIEGRSGWIVVDPLTSTETAEFALRFARSHLGDKKVSAIVFTHSHVDHFGGAQGVATPDEIRRAKIPVIAPAGFLEEATSENVLMGAAMSRRSMYMYGSRLSRSPEGLVDTGLGKAVAYGTMAILPPTRIIALPREEMTVDGVKFVFHNVPGSEAPAEFTFELPELKAYCGAEILTHTMHNLYTLRGAKVRDALRWAGYLDEALVDAKNAEVFFASHHWPEWGRERIRDFITAQRDIYKYIHDQTVRLMNAGLTAGEIAEKLRLPPSLDRHVEVRGYYGTLRHNIRAVYQFYLGWFDGNPANLDPLPPVEVAKRYVELAGGPSKIVEVARGAADKGDLRWAAELLKHAVLAGSSNREARELQARVLEKLGYAAESAPWRNFYLTGALELRDGPPERGINRASLLGMLEHTATSNLLDAMAASVNGDRAAGKNLRINLILPDRGESHVLWIENAVLHHRSGSPDPAASATLTIPKSSLLRFMTGAAGIREFLLNREIRTSGSRLDLIRFFSLIEKPSGAFPIMTR